MIKFGMVGVEEFKKLINDMKIEDVDFEAHITNDSEYVKALEYGSVPGQKPWPTIGPDTEMSFDPFDGEVKVVSKKGYAMLRQNADKARRVMFALMRKVDFDNMDKSLKRVIKGTAFQWRRYAKRDTPGYRDAKKSWKIEFKNI